MTNRPLRAVALIRMSTDRQLSSPGRQRELFRQFCERWSLQSVGDYADEGVSATSVPMQDRPGLSRLLADAKRKLFELVWCEETSRVARRPEDWFAIRAALGKQGVALVSHDEDPQAAVDSAIREFTQGLFALLARFEARQLGDRMRRAQQVKVAAGLYRGGYLPPGIGWDKERKLYVLDEASQPLAVRAFQVFADVRSFKAACLRLDSEGFLSRPGRPLSPAAVGRIVRNTAYRGLRRFGGKSYRTDLPEVVPSALVASVDTILADQAFRPQRSTHDYTTRAIFAGLLKCPECGSWLTVHYTQPRPNGRVYLSYKCLRSRLPPVTCGWRRMIPEMSFEAAIMPLIISELQENVNDLPPPSRRDRKRRRVEAERERLERERQRVVALHIRGRLSEEETDPLLDQLTAQLGQLEGDEEEERPQATVGELRATLRALQTGWPGFTPPEKRRILQAAILCIVPRGPGLTDAEVQWR